MKKNILLFILVAIIALILFFNISFSLPQSFADFVEDRAEDDNPLERITVQKSVWLENGEIEGPEDNREFTIEDENEIEDLLNKDVRVYDGGIFTRNEEDDFEIYFYYENENFQRYHVGENYIIARETSATEEHVFLTVRSDTNEIYNYLNGLYE